MEYTADHTPAFKRASAGAALTPALIKKEEKERTLFVYLSVWILAQPDADRWTHAQFLRDWQTTQVIRLFYACHTSFAVHLPDTFAYA
jgi:hypothetical protein